MSVRQHSLATGLVIALLVTLLSLARPLVGAEAPGRVRPAPSQGPATRQKLRVGVSPFAPFVIPGEKRPIGFSIDLWDAIARELGVDYEFVTCSGVADKLSRLEQGKLDVAIGGITITKAREESVDFSHPCFRTGLGILVRNDRGLSIWQSVKSMMTKTKLTIIISFLLLIVVSGHLMWWAERGKEAFSDHYVPGVFEGMYWAIVTASTVGYGDKAPMKWGGRILAGIVIIIALPLFCLFTAELTSTFTMEKLRSDIQGPRDLVGRRVGVIKGTTSDAFVSKIGATRVEFESVEKAVDALIQGDIEAVVYDAPTLQFYVKEKGEGRVACVDGTFVPQDFGLAVQSGNALREKINRAILDLRESGEVKQIDVKWFGTEAGK